MAMAVGGIFIAGFFDGTVEFIASFIALVGAFWMGHTADDYKDDEPGQ